MLAFASREKTGRDTQYSRFAVSSRRYFPQSHDTDLSAQAQDGYQAEEKTLAGRGHGLGFSFANMPVFPSVKSRSSSTANHDEMIQPVGAARYKPSCSCGGTCAKCRNPHGKTASGTELLTRDEEAMESREPKLVTKNGDGGGGAAAGGTAGGGSGTGVAAKPARSARLKKGPRYHPNGSLAPTNAGGRKSVSFDFDAVFDRDPAAGVFPECGEIHQDVKWNKAAADSLKAITGNPVPHAGFPAGHPANVWIEDRDTSDTRYGRRSGPHSAPVGGGGDEYTSAAGQDELHGASYHGHDGPAGPTALAGRWTFMVLAFDMCNHGVEVGNADFIKIDW